MKQEITREQQSKTVTVFVNNREVVLPDKETTGAEIKTAAEVPLDFDLYIEHGSNLDPVDNNERIKVHQKERFRAVSGQDVS